MDLTVHDAARMLNVSERAIYRWIREKSIPVHRVSDHYRFHRAELLEWATSRGMRLSSDEFHGPAANGTTMPKLSDALEALGSTGVGDGIAIPHVRNPVVLHVSHPSIT